MRTQFVHEWRATLDFLPMLQSTGANRYKDWRRIEQAIARLRYVKEAWIDHTCIVVLEFETQSADAAARRLRAFKPKLARILKRYGRWAKDSK